MAELEKVIKGLECCAKGNMCRNHCPYDGPENDIKNCTSQLARDALSLLKAQEPGWISVKDRMPDCKGQYLVFAIEAGRYKHITIVTFTDHFVMNGNRAYWKVTHWMALPEMPKEG